MWKRTEDAERGIRYTESSRKGILDWIPGIGKAHLHVPVGEGPSSTNGMATTNRTPALQTESNSAFFRTPSLFGNGGAGDHHPVVIKSDKVFVKKIKAVMYSFGSPRVGNASFAQLYDRVVPSTFRVVVDGDLVVGLPPGTHGYVHVGTEILIDSIASGSIIIDPSFVERWLRTHIKSSVAAHSLLVYRKSLLGLKLAAEYMKQYVEDRSFDDADPLKVAIRIRNNIEFTKLVEEHVNAKTVLNSNPVDLTRQISRGSENVAIAEDKVVLHEISDEKKLSTASEDDSPPKIVKQSSFNIALESSTHSETTLQDILEMEARHYERDKEHMEELMKHIEGSKRQGAIGWIKDHTVGKIAMKGSVTLSQSADAHDDIDSHH